MKIIVAALLLAVAICAEANQRQVVDVATWGPKLWGNKGPALVNSWTHWGNQWGGAGVNGGLNNGGAQGWNGGWGDQGVGVNGGVGLGGRGGWDNGANGIGDGGNGHDGKYVAANRGSVHVAPLVGHIQSVSSKNLDPAPGTTW